MLRTHPGLHRFAYANSNPARFVDPTGLASIVAQDIDTVRAQLATFEKELNQEFSEGTVADPTGNVRAAPSQALVLLLEQQGSTERALEALRGLAEKGASHVAFVVLEGDDFNEDGKLATTRVFEDFLGEVGTFAGRMPGLKDWVIDEVLDADSAAGPLNVSESFNAAFAFSSNEAENALGDRVDSLVKNVNDRSPEEWLVRHSAREHARNLLRAPYFVKLSLEGRAPREFKYRYAISGAQQAALYLILRRNARLKPRSPKPRARAPRPRHVRFQRWKRGEAIDKPMPDGSPPSWDTVRSRYWKNRWQASRNTNEFSKQNLDRMRRGAAPKDYNPRTGQFESRQLHHVVPQRAGGSNSPLNLRELTPDQHGAVDPFVHTVPTRTGIR